MFIVEIGLGFGKVMFECLLVLLVLVEVVGLIICEIGEIYFSQVLGKINCMMCVFVGVVGVISLWNFLFYLLL